MSEKITDSPSERTLNEGWACSVVDGEEGLELLVGDELHDFLVASAAQGGISVEELVAGALERLTEDRSLDADTT